MKDKIFSKKLWRSLEQAINIKYSVHKITERLCIKHGVVTAKS